VTEIPLAGLARVFGPLLSLFGQKLYVFVEVSFGQDKPYALTVLNRSNYRIVLESMQAAPDGFPEIGSGWSLNDSKLFQQKLLQPGQRLRMYLTSQDIGVEKTRRFKVQYSTVLFGKKIPRAVQVADCEFPLIENTVRVRSTWPKRNPS
jgi:hypothetical protein